MLINCRHITLWIKGNSLKFKSVAAAIAGLVMMVPVTQGEPGFYTHSSWPEVSLTVATATNTSNTIIRYIPGMTRGLDPGYDAGAFNQNPVFGIYTRLIDDNGINFAIQCLPDNDYENLVVPVGLNAAAGSQITFTANVSNLPPGKKVYLEDKLTGQFNRLDEAGSNYSVVLAGASQGAGRFYIHTKSAGLADAAHSILIPINASIIANGISTQVLSVLARDASGNYLARGGSAVTIIKVSGSGTIGAVTDFGNGAYSATVTSPTVPGSGIFVATLDGLPIKNGTGNQAESVITYTAGSADAAKSILTPTNASLVANGISTQVLTIQTCDASGNNLTSGGASVEISKSSGDGSVSAVTDNNNGTYTATVTSPTVSGSGTFVATLDGSPVKSGADTQTEVIILFTPGPANAGQSTLTPESASLMADGISTQVLTVQARDAFGNNLITGGSVVQVTRSAGTGILSSVTDHGDGSYSATVTAPAVTGSGTFVASLDAAPVMSGTGNQTVTTLTYTMVTKTSTGNGSWFNAGTWLPSGVPHLDHPVTVLSGHSINVDQIGAVCLNLLIENGGSLYINSGKSLTVGNGITSYGRLTINSDVVGSGTLITNGTSSGMVTYHKYITGGGTWNLVSAPVAGQSIRDFVLDLSNSISTQDNHFGLGQFVENQCDWLFYTNESIGSSGNFNNGQGYRASRTSNGTVTFQGPVANSASIEVLRSIGNDPGWNLVGNPFPAFMSLNIEADRVNNFLDVNRSSLEASHVGVYYWNSLTSDYEPVNHSSPADWIMPGQGFFIKASNPSIVYFPGDLRTHTPVSFTSTSYSWSEIELAVSTSFRISKTIIRFNPGMTYGLNPGYDCGTFEKEPSFGIYTRLIDDNGVNFAIQCLPDDDFENLIIPIGLKVPAASQIVFRTNICNLDPDVRVYLEDRLFHVFTRLDETEGAYTVYLDEGSDGIGRFFLITNPTNLAVQEEIIRPLTIIAVPRENTIRMAGTIDLPARFTIMDATGRIIFAKQLAASTDNELYLKSIPNGMYVVSIQSPKTRITQKIAWIR